MTAFWIVGWRAIFSQKAIAIRFSIMVAFEDKTKESAQASTNRVK
ncbi:hypothetical protein PN437_00700 [Microcystis aeruginosa CS-564/01]|nr:hypothetical protein [Microcystis aeruginosa]MDB9423470.1 hypothetical protein [Microcystis aeruginosa CS-564/01]